MSCPSRGAIEALEHRRLFANVVLTNGVLALFCSRVANVITVGLTPDQSAVTASVSFTGLNGPVNITKTFSRSSHIRMVGIRGGWGNDLITIDQTNGSFLIPTHIVSGQGNDTVMGGDEPDRVNGGAGADLLEGGGGNDVLIGGAGRDTLLGGAGRDSMDGGLGFDSLDGGDGSDLLTDWHFGDTLNGGAGRDVFRDFAFRLNTNNDFNPTVDFYHRLERPPEKTRSWFDQVLHDLFPLFVN